MHAQSHLTLCDPVNCSPPGSSIHGILQAGILEWVAIFYSRGPDPGIKLMCLASPPLTGRFFTNAPPMLPYQRGHKEYWYMLMQPPMSCFSWKMTVVSNMETLSDPKCLCRGGLKYSLAVKYPSNKTMIRSRPATF